MSIDLNAPEVQEAIKSAVKAAVESETSGLISKRDELLAEVKKLKKGQEIKPEQYEALEAELEATRDKLSEASKIAKNTQTEFEKVKKMFEAENSFTSRLLVDNGLQAELLKAGVTNPAHLKAVKSMLSGQVQVRVEGDERKAIIGDKTLADYVSEWSKSDEGKHFVAAPSNSGGGSTGGGNAGGSAKTMPRAQFDKISSAEKVGFLKDGGKLID